MSGLEMENNKMDLVSHSDCDKGEATGENQFYEDVDNCYSFNGFQSNSMIIDSQDNDMSDGEEDYSHFDDNDFPCSDEDNDGHNSNNEDNLFSGNERTTAAGGSILSAEIRSALKPSTNRLSVDKNDNTIILTEDADAEFPTRITVATANVINVGEDEEEESPAKRQRVLRFLRLDNKHKRSRWNISLYTREYQNFWKYFVFPEFNSGETEADQLDITEMENMKEWLQSNMVPVSQVKSYMEKTFRLRRRELESPNCLLVNFIQQWPRLFDYPGMIDVEFQRQHRNAGTLQVVWPALAENLLSHSYYRKILRDKFGVEKPTLTTGIFQTMYKVYAPRQEATIAAFLLLPYIIDSRPPKPKKPTKKMRKPAKSAKGNLLSESEFIRILPPDSHLYHFSQQPDLPTQPFIVISGDGPSLTFDNYAFMIERQIVACTSFLEAVDFCFKSFWIFNLQLPQGAEQIWNFLGNVVYNVVGDEVLFPGTKRLKVRITTASNPPSVN